MLSVFSTLEGTEMIPAKKKELKPRTSLSPLAHAVLPWTRMKEWSEGLFLAFYS